MASRGGRVLPRVIYHVATRGDWDAQRESRVYSPTESPRRGYVVCAKDADYVALANHGFPGCRDVVLLFIDTQRVRGQLGSGTVHGVPVLLHGAPLPVETVFEVAELPLADGFSLAPFVAHHETVALGARGDDTFEHVRERALRAVSGWNARWWIAGGWALDLHVGALTRPHADLELSILSSDQRSLHAYLKGWDLRAVAPGARLIPWDGTPLSPPYHQIWARQHGGGGDSVADFVVDTTMLDFLIEDHVGDQWRYRRDHRVTRDVRDIGAERDGLSYIRPEIALLYKTKQPRYKDVRDFHRAAPRLSGESRAWLAASVEMLHPQHPWSTRLRPEVQDA